MDKTRIHALCLRYAIVFVLAVDWGAARCRKLVFACSLAMVAPGIVAPVLILRQPYRFKLPVTAIISRKNWILASYGDLADHCIH